MWAIGGNTVATNLRRSNSSPKATNVIFVGGNKTLMIYQLSPFSDYLRHCWCFEELDQLEFHQNYTHYSLKSQSAFFDYTFLLSKKKLFYYALFLKINQSNHHFGCLRIKTTIFLSTIDFNGGIANFSPSNFYRVYSLYCGFRDDLKSQ